MVPPPLEEPVADPGAEVVEPEPVELDAAPLDAAPLDAAPLDAGELDAVLDCDEGLVADECVEPPHAPRIRTAGATRKSCVRGLTV